MADRYYRWVARTPPDFWAAIISVMYGAGVAGGWNGWAWAAIDDDRGPGLELSMTPFPFTDTYHLIAVWEDATWQSPMPTRPWTTTQGTSGELQVRNAPPTGPPDGFDAYWNALTAGLQDWFYLALDADSVALIDAQVVLPAAGLFQLGTMVFLFNGATEQPSYIVWSFQTALLGEDHLPDFSIAGYAMFSPAISPTTNAVMVGTELGLIANTLNDIALQDTELEINRGQAAYSVKGKITTG